MLTATEILDMLNASDEDIRIESKTGSDVDRSILETICAYSNEPGLDGGYIILGTHRENDEKNRQLHLQYLRICSRRKIAVTGKEQNIPSSGGNIPSSGVTVLRTAG